LFVPPRLSEGESQSAPYIVYMNPGTGKDTGSLHIGKVITQFYITLQCHCATF